MRAPCLLQALAGLALLAVAQALAQGLSYSGELQSSWRGQQSNSTGPLAAAALLSPGLVRLPSGSAVQRAELTSQWQPAGSRYGLAGRFMLESSRDEQGSHADLSRVNELALSADWGVWQASAGKKIVSWDVGYAWRPNDVVQQEVRRQLLPVTPEGRPLLMLEHFDADSAMTLVLVHPQRWRDRPNRFIGAEEAALAARGYWRIDALDAYTFARVGEHTGPSLGAAAAWVASEELELHGSVRLPRRHDVLVSSAGANPQPLASMPWQIQTRAGAAQWLLGGTWTGDRQQSLLAEVWHDGSAPSDAQWRDALARNAGLALLAGQQPSLRAAAAGNLAWQAEGLGGGRAALLGSNLRQDNAYLRASLQPQWAWPGSWTLAADLLFTPADRGHALGASLQWQGDRLRIDLAWRRLGGPADALLAQLPSRSSTALAASFSF